MPTLDRTQPITPRAPAGTSLTLEIGHHARPFEGEIACGDLAIVLPTDDGLVAGVIDGLGHGPLAKQAAATCAQAFARHGASSMEEIFAAAHRELSTGRGVVAALARFDTERGSVELGAIGDVTSVLLKEGAGGKQRVALSTMPGILGSAFRRVRVERVEFAPGDVLVMHTDGIRSGLDLLAMKPSSAQRTAEEIVATHGRAHDDACCLVVRGVRRFGEMREQR